MFWGKILTFETVEKISVTTKTENVIQEQRVFVIHTWCPRHTNNQQ